MSATEATGATPTTGATLQSTIEVAIDRDANDRGDWLDRSWAKSFAAVAVKTINDHGYVIVPAEQVLTAEDAAAIGRGLAFVDADRAVTAGFENPRLKAHETRMLSNRCLAARNAITDDDLARLARLARAAEGGER